MHLGAMEILLVLGLALLFFGPKRLPALGESLGSAMRSFKRSLNGAEDDKALPPATAAAPVNPQQNPPPRA